MKKETTFLTLPFFHIFFINLFFFLSEASLNMLPVHLNALGATKTYIGFYMNIKALALIIFVIFLGKYTNKIKRKKFIVTGTLSFIVSMICMFVFHERLYLLLFFQTTASLSFAFGFPLYFTFAYDLIPASKRRGGAAFYGISGLLTGPIGSFSGEMIIKYLHPRYMFIQALIFSLITLTLILFIKESPPQTHKKSNTSLWSLFARKELQRLIYISIIFGGMFAVFISFIPTFSQQRLGMPNLSSFFIAFSIIAVSARIVFFKVIDGISRKLLLAISYLCGIISLVLIVFLYHKWQLALIGLIYGVAHSILFPTLSATFVDKADKGEKILFSNAFLAFYNMGLILLSTSMGFLGDIIRTEAIFIGMTFFIVIALVVIVTDHEK